MSIQRALLAVVVLGMSVAEAEAAPVQIDVSRLSSPTVAFNGTRISGVGTYQLAAGHYTLFTTNNHLAPGDLQETVAFDVLSDGTVSYDPSLEGVLLGAGTASLTVHGIDVTFTSQLTQARLFVNFGNVGPQILPGSLTLHLLPGPYFASQGSVLSTGSISFGVTFSVASDGTVAIDPGETTYLSVPGARQLSIDGLPVTFVSQLSSSRLFMNFGNYGPTVPTGTTAMRLLPGTYWASQGSVQSNNTNVLFGVTFTVNADDTVSYDASEASYVGGAGTSTLALNGFPMTVVSQLSNSQLFVNFGNFGPVIATGTTTYHLLPGPYFGGQGSQQADGSFVRFGVAFAVGNDGTVTADPSEAAYVATSGSTMTIAGFPVHIDSQLTIAQLFVNFGNFGPSIKPGPTDLHLLPGAYYGGHASAGGRNGVSFSVATDGTVAYPAAETGFLAGIGTPSLTIAGYPITVQSQLTGARLFMNFGNIGPVLAPGTTALRLLPGNYDGSTPTTRANNQLSDVAFTVAGDGTLAFASAEDAYVTGRGSTTLVILGFPVQIDFRQFPASSYSVWSFATFTNDRVQTIDLLPGSFELLAATATFPFTVSTAGAIGYSADLATSLSGAGTSRLTYGNAVCTTNSDCSGADVCNSGTCGADSSAPVVSLAQVAPYVNQPVAVVTATVTDNGTLGAALIKVNGQQVATVTPGFGGLVTATVVLAEGSNVIEVDASDAAGNVGTASTSVIVDTHPPVATIVSPVAGQAIGTPEVSVVVQVTDTNPTTVAIGAQLFVLPAGGGLVTASVGLAAASGSQAIAVLVTDAAGNATPASTSVLVDLDAPLVSLDVADGAAFAALPGDALPLTIQIDDVGATTVTVSGGAALSLPRGGGVVQTVAPLVEGTQTIAIAVVDEAGLTTTETRTVIYDRTPPSLAIASPGASTVRGLIDVSADAADSITGVAAVSVAVDGGAPSVLASVVPGAYTTSLDTATLGDGGHVLAFRAVDRVGNVATASVMIVVDNTAPTVAIASPADGSYVRGTVAFTATASDATSGVASIVLAVNGSEVARCASSPCTASVDTSALPNGAASFVATASDAAGNTAPLAQVTATVANEVIAGFLTSPASGAVVTTGMTVAVHITDPYFAAVECFVGGRSLGISGDPDFHADVSLLDQLDGALTVRCDASDLAGNVGSQSANVTVKNWTEMMHPQALRLKENGSHVTMSVRGVNVAILTPIAGKQLALTVPGGTPVPAVIGRIHGSDDDGDCDDRTVPHVDLKFDRRAFVASVQAGIAAHAIDPTRPVTVTLVSDSHVIGSDTIRVSK